MEVKQIKEQDYNWNEVEEWQNMSRSVKAMKHRTKKCIWSNECIFLKTVSFDIFIIYLRFIGIFANVIKSQNGIELSQSI